MKIATIQSKVYEDKYKNIENLAEIFASGKVKGADFVVLPEMWNCPYIAKNFPKYAEHKAGDTILAMSTLARKNNVYLIGGSIPEIDDNGKVYNTCYVFNRKGEVIGKHRKVHLFDVNFGLINFYESDTLTAGSSFDTIDTEFGKVAVNICFDVRFPEGMRLQALEGAKTIFLPAAFMKNTGKAHWDINLRMRAIENQVFLVADAPARDKSIGYEVWAHSCVINPWGTVLTDMGEDEGVAITEIDLSEIDRVRKELPLMSARREDVYTLEKK